MNSEKLPKRIRIQGKPGNVIGCMLVVTDAETGKAIPGIHTMVLHLSARGNNKAEVTYHETDNGGRVIAGSDKKPIDHTNTVEVAEIDITAECWG